MNFFKFFVIKTLDPDPDWYSAENTVSGSGIKESGAEALRTAIEN
jgi:hypothetical protein